MRSFSPFSASVSLLSLPPPPPAPLLRSFCVDSSGINAEIKVNGQKLDTVTSFKYLGSVITDEGSNP